MRPSILAASGTGTRNLYSREDIYWMALVNQLSEAGLSSDVIHDVLQVREDYRQQQQPTDIRHGAALKIQGESGRLSHASWWSEEALEHFFASPPPTPPGAYSLDLRPLWKRVDQRIAKLIEGRKRGKQRA